MSEQEQLLLDLLRPPPEPSRVRLPAERDAITHKITIPASDVIYDEVKVDGRILYEKKYVDLDIYITVGLYSNGSPGEVFIKVGKAGGVWKAYDALMVAVSLGLQYGIPLGEFTKKFSHMRFEPCGPTTNAAIPIVKSIVDYLARWLDVRFPQKQSFDETAERVCDDKNNKMSDVIEDAESIFGRGV